MQSQIDFLNGEKMTLEELKEAVDDYFGDTSRGEEETAKGLREIAEQCEMMADAIEANGG
jgi:hypothetical protein